MEMKVGSAVIKSSYSKRTTEKQRKQIAKIRKRFYRRNREEMLWALCRVLFKNGVMIGPIYEYFFARVANDAKRFDKKATINEALASDQYLTAALNHIKAKRPFYTGRNMVENIKQGFRTGGIGGVKKLANFPMKPALNMIEKYAPTPCQTRIYVDTSCGWGTRMLAAAASDMNYVGFDVNPKLIKKLEALGNEIRKLKPGWKFKIVAKGSEILYPELKGHADFMMTSPPYFCLEDYGHGSGQSYKSGTSYKSWCRRYLKPLMRNSFKYCKRGTYCLINIKDFDKYDLVAKTVKYGTQAGFTFVGFDSLKLGAIKSASTELRNLDEPVLVFRKEK